MPNTNDALIAKLQTDSLLIAIDLVGKIRTAQTKVTAEYPLELIKLMGPVIKTADDLNGISLSSAIDRVTKAGYKITTED